MILIAAGGLSAQTPPAAAVTARGSISGVVRAEGTGAPIPDAEIGARRTGGRPATAAADAEGRYALRSLDAGSYTVFAVVRPSDGVGFGAEASRTVTLQPDQELTGIDIQVSLPGRISGKVLDENGEPVADIRVALVAREYSSGALRYVFAGAGITDDQGKYALQRVTPGRAYLLLAMKLQMRLPAVSNAPDDPKLRRPAPMATYYPDSPNPEGGDPLTLRVGESREGVDIRMRKAASYCLEGVLIGPMGPAELNFSIALQRPTSGPSGDGAMYMGMPGGKTARDGKVRICDLYPAEYELEVAQWAGRGGPDFLGVAAATISNRDVAGVRVTALPKIPVPGEAAWDGAAPEQPLDTALTIDLRSLSRTIYPTAKSSLPGQFSFDGIVPDEYSWDIRGLSGGLYLKDVTYGNQSILRKSLRIGGAPANSSLRVLVARDGGFIAARVADRDGSPAGNVYVLLIPANAGSEPELAASTKSGATNQNGTWTSAALAPGKYFALATRATVDKSPESIGKLWRARTQGEQIDLQPNQTAQVTLELKGIE